MIYSFDLLLVLPGWSFALGRGKEKNFPSFRLWLPSQVVVTIRASILLLQYRFSTAYNLKSCRSYMIILKTIFVRIISNIFFSYRFSRLFFSFLTKNMTRGLRRQNFKYLFIKLHPSTKTAFVCRNMPPVLIFWFARKEKWKLVSHITDRTWTESFRE